MGHKALSVQSLRGCLACFHENLSGADSLAHLSRPQQRARLAARLLAPFQCLPRADFELLLIDWIESEPLPTIAEVCTLLAALLALDEADKASTVAELIAEAPTRAKAGKTSTPRGSVVWWAQCICERCEPLAKHLPDVHGMLKGCLADCDAELSRPT